MRTISPLGLLGLTLGGLSLMACASPIGDDADRDEPAEQTGQRAQSIWGCPEDVCGSNSPKIEAHGFHELNARGLPNPEQMRIVGAEHGKLRTLQVRVANGQLIASRGARMEWSGSALVGLRIFVEANIRDQLRTYELEVMAYRNLPYPVGAKGVTGAYVIEYTDSEGDRQNLCGYRPGGSPRDVPGLPWDEAYGQHPLEVIVFEGDRIDTATMTIDKNVDPDWFTFGCAGHTLAKLHLTRNTQASNAAGHEHPHSVQQAVLKMFAGDYCGDGTPFTVAGQPLTWRDEAGVMSFYGVPTTLEARWKDSGAACLYEPRMMHPATPEGRAKFPQILDAIRAVCPRLIDRPCLDTDLDNLDGYPIISGNRVP
jgi:ADYC domain